MIKSVDAEHKDGEVETCLHDYTARDVDVLGGWAHGELNQSVGLYGQLRNHNDKESKDSNAGSHPPVCEEGCEVDDYAQKGEPDVPPVKRILSGAVDDGTGGIWLNGLDTVLLEQANACQEDDPSAERKEPGRKQEEFLERRSVFSIFDVCVCLFPHFWLGYVHLDTGSVGHLDWLKRGMLKQTRKSIMYFLRQVSTTSGCAKETKALYHRHSVGAWVYT